MERRLHRVETYLVAIGLDEKNQVKARIGRKGRVRAALLLLGRAIRILTQRK